MKCQTTLLLFFFATAAISVCAQTPGNKKIEWSLDGMLGISYGSETMGINVGGPSLKMRIHKIKIGVGAFPSLIIADDKAMPRLAVSPVAEYKKLMLIVPYYGYDNKNEQIWTFGLGYRFF